ncbi:hypothetical protein [Hyalangium gracile]|uniref:hypothetical protein n=1 Tax=Hyalangium gracile TaxID=394092 RepID=UPI001CCC605A|nr:hypothetical protein [Hyalangium gracile]
MTGTGLWKRRALLAVLGVTVALGSGCSHPSSGASAPERTEPAPQADPAPTSSPKPTFQGAEAQGPVGSPGLPPPPAGGPVVFGDGGGPPATGSSSLPAVQTVPPAQEVGLPPEAGQVRMVAEGCLAHPDRGSAFPPAAPSRTASRAGSSQVQVTPVANGVSLVHPLEHACCLTARAQAQVEGQRVTIVETLEGEPCRCRCGSTVRSAVRLAPGSYSLRVVVREPGGERQLFEGPVTVAR